MNRRPSSKIWESMGSVGTSGGEKHRHNESSAFKKVAGKVLEVLVPQGGEKHTQTQRIVDVQEK
eukprot:7556162-Pyramimonas_sp.AAC.1